MKLGRILTIILITSAVLPVCAGYVPYPSVCYDGGQFTHSEVRLVYHTRDISRVLVVFELPGR